MLGFQQHVTFKEDTHQYFNPEGKEYTSVSRAINSVTPEFDREGISLVMARKKAKDEGIGLTEAQDQILGQWDAVRDSSIERGNWIHSNIESYLTIASCDETLIPVSKRIAKFAGQYYKYYPEAIIYDSDYKIAGQTDLALQRQKDVHGVWDFADYKTNESRGIYFDSIKRKDGKIEKHYNQFFKPPLDHLEHCNFNRYAIQLSMYAYMASQTYGLVPGKLMIIFIDVSFQIRVHYVPYMKMEVIALLNHYRDLVKSSWEE